MCTESIIDGRRGDLGRFPWEYRALAIKTNLKKLGLSLTYSFTDWCALELIVFNIGEKVHI